MSRKNKKYVWAKRTRLRKFVDLLNKLELFKDKIDYPVMHPRKILSDEEVRAKLIPDLHIFDELSGTLSEEEIEDLKKSYEEVYERLKDDYKVCASYIDEDKRVLTISDNLMLVLKSLHVKDVKNEVNKYICKKILDMGCEIKEVLDEGDNIFSISGSINEKLDDGLEVYYGPYYIKITFVKVDEEMEMRKDTCDLYLDFQSCGMTIYL